MSATSSKSLSLPYISLSSLLCLFLTPVSLSLYLFLSVSLSSHLSLFFSVSYSLAQSQFVDQSQQRLPPL